MNNFLNYLQVLDDSVNVKVILDTDDSYDYEESFTVYEFKYMMKIDQPSLYNLLCNSEIYAVYPQGDTQVIHLRVFDA